MDAFDRKARNIELATSLNTIDLSDFGRKKDVWFLIGCGNANKRSSWSGYELQHVIDTHLIGKVQFFPTLEELFIWVNLQDDIAKNLVIFYQIPEDLDGLVPKEFIPTNGREVDLKRLGIPDFATDFHMMIEEKTILEFSDLIQ